MFETTKIAVSAWKDCMKVATAAMKQARSERESMEASKERHPSNY